MNKLKPAISYECLTKIKPILIFYAIEYAFTALIFAVIALCAGVTEFGFNGSEISSVIFISVLGALGFHVDFKALLQNGFTRGYIFLSTFCSFLLLSAAMALFDALLGNALHYGFHHFFTLFGMLYGYGHIGVNWLWLIALYTAFCNVVYFVALVINKVGKTASLLIGTGLAGAVLLIAALFRFVFSARLVSRIGGWALRAFGFMQDGTVYPLVCALTLLAIGGVFALGSYALLRHTELK